MLLQRWRRFHQMTDALIGPMSRIVNSTCGLILPSLSNAFQTTEAQMMIKMSEFNKDRAEKRLNVLYYLGRIGARSGTPEDEVESEMEDIAFSAAEQGLQFHWRMGNWTLRPMTPGEQTAFQEATMERVQ